MSVRTTRRDVLRRRGLTTAGQDPPDHPVRGAPARTSRESTEIARSSPITNTDPAGTVTGPKYTPSTLARSTYASGTWVAVDHQPSVGEADRSPASPTTRLTIKARVPGALNTTRSSALR